MLDIPRPRRRFTVEEYLLLEERSPESRSEFYNGEIFAMSGGTLEHNRILNNVARFLSTTLATRGCEAFTSDVRLYVESHGLFTYPDILVICGPPKLLPGRKDTVTDAGLIVEVLSPTTESYDRGAKSNFYRAVPSLQQIILISQDEPRVDTLTRQSPEGWLLRNDSVRQGSLALPAFELELPLSTIYAGMPFEMK